jgi:hypothetical protein
MHSARAAVMPASWTRCSARRPLIPAAPTLHVADLVRRAAPLRPGKVIAGGEEAFVVAFLWVNPVVSVTDGFAIPPTVQLAGRNFRVALHELNITDAAVGANVVNPLQQGTRFGDGFVGFGFTVTWACGSRRGRAVADVRR